MGLGEALDTDMSSQYPRLVGRWAHLVALLALALSLVFGSASSAGIVFDPGHAVGSTDPGTLIWPAASWASTTGLFVAGHAYDPAVALASVDVIEIVAAGPSVASDELKGSASPSSGTPGAFTTPHHPFLATNSSRLVPGGGLAAHEAAGGHALARHVGMSDADLIARIGSSPGISGASSFSSRAVAEATTADLLAANSSQVSTWLGGTGGKLVLSGPAGGNVGRYVAQGSTTVIDATGSTVVLIRDASTGVGYRIQTAFPTP